MTPHQGTIKKPRIAPTPATVSAPASRMASVRQAAPPATVSRMASTRVPMSAAPKAYQNAASVSRPASSMGGNFRTASSASYAAGPGSPSRIPGPSPHLPSRPFGAPPSMLSYASGYGARSVTTASVGLAAKTVKAQRESFRPRPSLVAKVPRSATVVGVLQPQVPEQQSSHREEQVSGAKWVLRVGQQLDNNKHTLTVKSRASRPQARSTLTLLQ